VISAKTRSAPTAVARSLFEYGRKGTTSTNAQNPIEPSMSAQPTWTVFFCRYVGAAFSERSSFTLGTLHAKRGEIDCETERENSGLSFSIPVAMIFAPKALRHVCAPAHTDHLSGDVARRIRGQEESKVRDVFGPTQTRDRETAHVVERAVL
jgi:hypothetical protein